VFAKKVEEGLEGIKKDILADSVFSTLSKDQLAEVIGKGLLEKINNPEFKTLKEQLIAYLEKKEQDLSFLEAMARTTTQDFLKKDPALAKVF
jgi:hypothetical protein